ncbi:MAG: hypothetical protein RLZZ528_1507 [Pseudomonadota bacterium]
MMVRRGMVIRTAVLGLGLLAGLAGGAASAQTLRDIDGPAEVPPASYSASQYVDSKGCVFVRAGYAGQVTWVPRVTRDRKVICGQAPSLAAAARPAVTAPASEEAKAVAEGSSAPARLAEAEPKPQAAQVAASPAVEAAEAPASLRLVSVATVPSDGTGCAGKTATAERFTLSDGRTVLRCGAPVADPVSYLNGAGLGVTVTGAAPVRQAEAPAARLPQGYEPAWDDDRLNPNRGARTSAAAAEPVARVEAAAPSPAVAATPQSGPGGGYVQVGAFAVAANARAAADMLRALGLPVAERATRLGSKDATIVLAGPFADGTGARAALKKLRSAGFADAFLH